MIYRSCPFPNVVAGQRCGPGVSLSRWVTCPENTRRSLPVKAGGFRSSWLLVQVKLVSPAAGAKPDEDIAFMFYTRISLDKYSNVGFEHWGNAAKPASCQAALLDQQFAAVS
jgi:hypothetical protein